MWLDGPWCMVIACWMVGTMLVLQLLPSRSRQLAMLPFLEKTASEQQNYTTIRNHPDSKAHGKWTAASKQKQWMCQRKPSTHSTCCLIYLELLALSAVVLKEVYISKFKFFERAFHLHNSQLCSPSVPMHLVPPSLNWIDRAIVRF